MIFLGVGLFLIVGLSIIERVKERPSFDWSRSFRQAPLFAETDLQVEGLARAGDVRQAVAMFQRLHKVDQKKAQRAVSLLASGQREQAAALAKSGPSVLPSQSFSRRNTKLGQLAEAMAAIQAAKNAAGRRKTRYSTMALILGATGSLLAQTPKLGTISFPTSGSPKAQAAFTRGVLYLHNFEYDDAAKSFQEAERIEPGFAMAYWGEAMSYNHPVWQSQDRDKAVAALAKLGSTPEARRAKAKTEREGRWLSAVEALYGEGNKYQRDTLYSKAMARLAAEYPKDVEAQAFYALSLLGMSYPGRDVSLYMRAAAICEEIFRDHPDHPGAAHYLIHSYDDPVHGPLGLRAARAYSTIAPSAPHAQHMTSHIFLALGMWDETVASNEVATKMTGTTSGHYALWLTYGYLQQGRYEDAQRVLGQMQQDVAKNPTYGKRYHLAAGRAAYLVETKEWDGDVARITVDTAGLNPAPFLLGLPEGWAALDRGDTATTGKVIKAMEARLEQVRADTSSKLGSLANNMEIMQRELMGMMLVKAGKNEEGVALLRQAAAQEDTVPYDFGPPETIKPPKELLGEVLLAVGKPADAKVAFEQSLARTPRRPASLIGLATAATKTGDIEEASTALSDLEKVWKGPAEKRPKVVAAR
ncbi:MAG TPA: tetratricopeptide repeat protein [Gemmatimonadales bacterium]|nr:tetratricopeptide repeat protein [Gemmatimonadales bacterium]